MIYSKLADIYDDLVKDEEATKYWVCFVKENVKGHRILELACGSGEITVALAKAGYNILATDISPAMLAQAKAKESFPNLEYRLMDMLELPMGVSYDGVICFCDSLNYLEDYQALAQVFSGVYNVLNEQGVFLFDLHQESRLQEFKNGWREEGAIKGLNYSWQIVTQEDKLIHDFTISDANQVFKEKHHQRVFALKKVKALLADAGYDFEVWDDYDIFREDLKEKYFFKAKKLNS